MHMCSPARLSSDRQCTAGRKCGICKLVVAVVPRIAVVHPAVSVLVVESVREALVPQ